MMRFLALFILFLFLRPLGAAAIPTTIRLADHENGAIIQIPPAGEMTVDFSGTALLDDPDHRLLVIQLQGNGRSDYYSVDLEPERQGYLLNARTLRPHVAPPFPGFRPDYAVYLLIGKETSPGSLRHGIFDSRWEIYLQVD